MPAKYRHTKINNFFKRVISDFDGYYNRRRRIFFHILFWSFLLAVYMFDLLLVNSGFTINIAFVLAFRQIAQNILLFYFTCYFIFPKLLYRGRYIAGIILLSIPFLLAPAVNYLAFKIFYKLLLENKVGELYIDLGLFARDFHSIFKKEEITLSFMPILLRTMPAFLVKMLVSTIRFFSNAGKQKIKQHELEMQNLQLEVNFLKSQMNPHYLFNTLNNIYSYVFLKDERALSMISDLSEVMQYTLYESREIVVPLERELRFIEHYLRMEKTRNSGKGAVIEFTCDHADTQEYVIAPLIFFPFVENAIKYGINLNKRFGYVRIHIESDGEGSVTLNVKNSKTNPSLFRARNNDIGKREAGGIGLSVTKRRLAVLYPSAHELTIDNKEDEYAVLLKIQCVKNEPEITVPYS